VREKRIVLEYRVHVSIKWCKLGHIGALKEYLATAGGFEASDYAKNCGLSRSGRAKHGEELPLGDFKVEIRNGGDIAKGLV
jgi:hypothetical protein